MYFLYRHIRNDKNIPFYIGIGKSYPREPYKRAYASSPRNRIWKMIVSKTSFEVEILYESKNENFIKEKEREFIRMYGRIDLKTGSLANLTEGGDGLKEMGEEAISALRTRMIGNKIMNGRKLPSSQREKMSKSHLGIKPSEKSISLLNERNKGNKYGAKNKGLRRTQEVKSKLSSIKINKPTSRSKKFLCQSSGKTFSCFRGAAREMFPGNYKNAAIGIMRCCEGRTKWYKGYIFKYI